VPRQLIERAVEAKLAPQRAWVPKWDGCRRGSWARLRGRETRR